MENSNNDQETEEKRFLADDTIQNGGSIPRYPFLERRWRWIVLISAFVINVVIDGCSYTFGVLLTDLLENFNATRSHIAWIGSVFCAVPLLCGPIANVIRKRIGLRRSTILGGFIAFIGFVCGSFSDSVMGICLSYGVVAGFGVSMPYLNSVVVVAMHFEKNRALATGIAECGTGVGTLLFAPLLELWISEYGWRGAMLILAGIMSNVIVCGATFRPNTDKFDLETNVSSTNESSDTFTQRDLPSSCSDLYNYRGKSSFRIYSMTMYFSNSGNIRHTDNATGGEILDKRNSGPLSCNGSHNLQNRYTQSCPNLEYHQNEDGEIEAKCRTKQYIVDLSVLTNPTFFCFALSNFVIYFWNDIPYMYIVDKTLSLGVEKTRASFLVSIIGVVHTFGTLLFGLIADRSTLNRSVMYCVNIVLCGFSLLVLPFCSTFLLNAVFAGCFGLFSAILEVTTCVIIIEILGINRLPDAYGVNMFLQGVATLIGPPFAGFLYDISGSYDNTFYAAGGCIMGAGFFFFLVHMIRKFTNCE